MQRVIIESPYGSSDPAEVEANVEYLRRCMAHALSLGVAPFASHGLYTQPGVLDDENPTERDLGIRAGFAWGEVADEVWIYVDRGVSAGMLFGIRRAECCTGQPIHYVELDAPDGERRAYPGSPRERRWTAALLVALEVRQHPGMNAREFVEWLREGPE